MKKFKCHDCGVEMEGRYLWVCEDDVLRCGHCINEWMADNRATLCSACQDFVEGNQGIGR